MRCQDIHELLAELVGDELSPVAQGLVEAHVSRCKPCEQALERERALRGCLRSLPVAAMPEGFAARALRAAREADAAAQGRSSVQRLKQGLSIAASVLFVCGVGFMLGRGSQDLPDQLAMVEVPMGTAQMVALKIDAPQAFSQVEFSVSLPHNVALRDQPELREFAWTGQLRAGMNVLSLPLVGVVPEGGELVATVRFGAATKSLRIPLRVPAQG